MGDVVDVKSKEGASRVKVEALIRACWEKLAVVLLIVK